MIWYGYTKEITKKHKSITILKHIKQHNGVALKSVDGDSIMIA